MMSVLHRSCHAVPSRGLVAVLLATLLLGCRDAESDPVALVLGEAGGALALDAELPSLPDLSARAGVSGELRAALDLWEASWDEVGGAGEALRSEACGRAAPELARVLGTSEVSRLSQAVQGALEAIDSFAGSSSDPQLAAALGRAQTLQWRSDEALDDGDTATALAYGLQASDALRAFSPSRVAQAFLEEARAALAAAGDSIPDHDRVRAVRLIEGAESALLSGEWMRAVRRSFYASQLLDHQEG